MSALERAARAARDDAAIYGAILTMEQAGHIARAVLLAVREADEAVAHAISMSMSGHCEDDPVNAYMGGIDAILSEGE